MLTFARCAYGVETIDHGPDPLRRPPYDLRLCCQQAQLLEEVDALSVSLPAPPFAAWAAISYRLCVPEGDTIFRLAARLRPLLVGRRLSSIRSRKHGEVPRLSGSEVEAIDARGKHLLIALAGGFTLRVHLGIRGRCHLYQQGERWRRPGWRATLVLQHTAGEVVFFDAPQVQIARTKLMAGDRALSQLGPDLLDDACDLDEVVRRAKAAHYAAEPIAHVLLDQRVSAGIGNVFKCEVLFIERVHPWQPTADLSTDKLLALFERSRILLRANTGAGPRVTVPPALRERGARVWVYRRVGRPCLRCRTPIKSRQSGPQARTTYFCPRCQATKGMTATKDPTKAP